MATEENLIPIFPGQGGLNTGTHPTNIGDGEASAAENVTFDEASIESPGGTKKLHRDIPIATGTSFAPASIVQAAADLDNAIVPRVFIPYHEMQDPETEWQLDVSFRLNHRTDDCLTGADQSTNVINAPKGGEFQFQPLVQRGGDDVTRLQWILGLAVVNPAGGSGAAEFIRPVFYWWDSASGRLKFSAAFTVIRPGEDYHIQLQIGTDAGDSRWIVNGVEVTQITSTDLIVALPDAGDIYDSATKRPIYIGKGVTRTTGVGRYSSAKQVAGVYNNSASGWTGTSITASPALPVTAADAWKGYFARRVQDGVIRQVTTSSGSTLTFAASSWSGPSASDEFDLIPPMEACHQDCVIQEVRLWSERQYERQWDYSSPFSADGYLPQIRMQRGDEDRGINAFFYRSDTGAEWKMRGLTCHTTTYNVFVDSRWDADEIRRQLQLMRNSGLNTIKITFRNRGSFNIATPYSGDGLNDSIMANVGEFLDICSSLGLYCLIQIDAIPTNQKYHEQEYTGTGDDVTVTWANGEVQEMLPSNPNSEVLSPYNANAMQVFLTDFCRALKENVSDPRVLRCLMGLDLTSEGFIRITYPPFRSIDRANRAKVANTNTGGDYYMDNDEDRKNVVLDNLRASLNLFAAAVRAELPDTLIGANIFANAAGFLSDIDLTWRNGSFAHSYPFYYIQDADIDYWSINLYLDVKVPGALTHDFSDCMATSRFDQLDMWRRPVIVGEIGIPQTMALDATNLALLLDDFREIEELGYKGYTYWYINLLDQAFDPTDFYDWEDEPDLQERITPITYPVYQEAYRSSTLDWALQPGHNTANERDVITRFEGLNVPKLVGYWPLHDDGGVRCRDYSPTANHGWFGGIPFDPTVPGEVLLDGERTAIQIDMDKEPDLYESFRHVLGQEGRYCVGFRARVRICRDVEDNGEASIEDCLYETLFDIDNPASTTAAPILSVRWTKHSGTRKFYFVWNTGSGEQVWTVASSVESNPQTSATLANGLRPAPGREFTLLAGVQPVDGSTDHRFYCFVLNADGNAVGYSEKVTPSTPVVLADLAKSRFSFGASVVGEETKGAGTKNAAMVRISDAAVYFHPVVDTQSATTSAQNSMELSPYVSHGVLDVTTTPIGADAGLVALTRNSDAFTVVGSGTLAKDRRHYPQNWIAMVPSVEKVRRRENRVPFGRPKFVFLESVTASGGTLGDLWDEPSQPAAALHLALWMAATDFPRETDALASNPTPPTGESWALTPLWKDKGALGSVDPFWWSLAILPSRSGVPQEAFAPRWARGVVKEFEAVRGQAQVDIADGDRHHIAAVGGSLYRVLHRRVADHPFYGEESPRGGTYDWCVEFPQRPLWLSQEEELRQPKRLSRPREQDPWPEDGVRVTDGADRKLWLPNNSGTAGYWLLECWVKIPSVWGKRTIACRVGTEQGSTSLVESVNFHFYLDAGAPEFEIRDDLNSRSFRMFLGSNGKMKMRDVMRPNEWVHLAVMVNLTTSGAISAGTNGFFVRGQRMADVHQEIIGSMTCAQIPNNVTQAYWGVYGQGQSTRFTPWRSGLAGRIALGRVRTSDTVFPNFDPEKF